MSLKGAGYIVGAYEHPTRKAADKSVTLLHAECAKGALEDAGLTKDDVDGYYCAGDAPGLGPLSMVDYMNLKCRHVDSTDVGGSSYQVAVGHALQAIAAGRCSIALITLAGRPRSEGQATGTAPRAGSPAQPEVQFEFPYGPATANMYAMCATRHMHQYGTTSEQLAWIKVAASHHAQHNPHAMLRDVVTVEDVVKSPMVASPLHRLDCCVISDGGGALIVTKPEIAKSLKRPLVKVIGVGESPKHQAGGDIDLTYLRRALVGAAGVGDGGHQAVRHQVRLDLRQLHHHRADADRGPGLLREGPGRQVRVRRQPDLRRRQAAVQHRRRRTVQQPSGEPRRHHQDHRGGASVARRGASGGAGEELRPGDRAWHRRFARHPALRQHSHPGAGVIDMAYVQRKVQFVGTPDTNPETKPFWDGCAAGKFLLRRCTSCKKAHWYPRSLCPFCFGDCEWVEASGKGKIYTFSVMTRAETPYAIGYVTLEEGPSMMTNFVDCDFATLKIGQDVKLKFVPSEGGPPIPMFAPV